MINTQATFYLPSADCPFVVVLLTFLSHLLFLLKIASQKHFFSSNLPDCFISYRSCYFRAPLIQVKSAFHCAKCWSHSLTWFCSPTWFLRGIFFVGFETLVISLYISFTKQELLTGLAYTYRDQLNISV